ncbi:MAG: DUF1016 family protein [Bacteroidetes bacterium]|nr:DUF1016 family protein [Bacteroidota bacterium]
MNALHDLISNIGNLHQQLQQHTVKSINQLLTIRNFLIGFYIVEFEQDGANRAEYGQKLLVELAKSLKIKGLSAPELSRCRQFYLTYPQIFGTLPQKFSHLLPQPILGALPQKSKLKTTETELPLTPPEKIISQLSFSHLVELLKIDDRLKRTFYEIECIKGTWSTRELKRQISSQYFERSALSNNKQALSKLANQEIAPKQATDIIKNIYAFEFLELGVTQLVEESDLETALLDHLQQFILELGHGFCFEARQKRITIGDSYYFIDLVFYHRLLKCHVLIELKIGAFDHGNIGQLNTYLNFYKKNVLQPDDKPPVGILLVAEKDHALVEYATAGMDQNLFVQQYMLQLPDTETLKAYLTQELKNYSTHD